MRASMEYCLVHTCLVLVGFFWFAVAMQKRCLFHKGECIDRCPVGMHPYHTRCDVDTLSQRTCFSPEIYILGFTCGWSRCDCDGDLVLSDHDGCIPLSDCVLKTFHAKLSKRKRRRGKKFKLRDSTDIDELHRGLDPIHHIGNLPQQTAPPGTPEYR